MVELLFLLMLGIFTATGSVMVWFMRARKARFAKQHGIVYCPRCDSDMILERHGSDTDFSSTDASPYACRPCGHEFTRAGHVPAPLA
jgi:hypothetical protein